jgi:hypothetical protein
MFHLDLGNTLIVVYLKLVSIIALPALVCFSWLYLWVDNPEPFKYLSIWNCCTQALFLVINLMRVPPIHWGAMGWLYIGLSATVIALYSTRLHNTKWGFFVLGGLILLNVVLVFIVTLNTYSMIHPFFADSKLESVRYMGSFVTEFALMGAVFSSSSQLYWHDILIKRREKALVEHVFNKLEEETSRKEAGTF